MLHSFHKLPLPKALELLLKHVEDFGDRYQLWPSGPNQKSFIALSGGADSILLAYCLVGIFKKRSLKLPVALHVNYGTRPESDSEESLCREFCKQEGISFFHKKVEDLKLSQSNFEKKARDIRYDFFKEFLKDDDLLFMGHHLDDCYEWSMMMQLKSSNLKSKLGIPVKNKKIRRPLHCLSKEQILGICQKLNLSFANDSSNDSIAFERNKIRQLITKLKVDFPNLLKNYVPQQNELLSLYTSREKIHYSLEKCQFGGVILRFRDQDLSSKKTELQNLLRSFIAQYSNKERGKLRDQLMSAVEGYFNHKMGPYSFSGDVLIYPLPNGFYILNKKIQKRWEDIFKDTQIPNFRHPVIQITQLEEAQRNKTKVFKKAHPLILVMHDKLIENRYGWSYKL